MGSGSPREAKYDINLTLFFSGVRAHTSQNVFTFLSMMPRTNLEKARRFLAFPSHNRAMASAAPTKGVRGQFLRAASSSSSSSEEMSARSPARRMPSPIAINSAYTSRTYSMAGRPSGPGLSNERGVSNSTKCCRIQGRLRSRNRCRNRSVGG